MKKRLSVVLLTVAALLVALAAGPVFGRNQANGLAVQSKSPDAQKVGLMTRVGFDLASLYEEYQAYVDEKSTDEGFAPSNQFLRVSSNRVLIEAVALEDGERLESDLKELGMEGTAHYGRMVSGQLPVGAIEKVGGLANLKSARPLYAMARGGLTPIQRNAATR